MVLSFNAVLSCFIHQRCQFYHVLSITDDDFDQRTFGDLVYLGGGLEHLDYCSFPYIGNVIIPIDALIFFRGVGIPPTSLSDVFAHRDVRR